MKTFNEFVVHEYLEESEKKLAKLAADIEKRKGLLDLATEKRKMSKGSRRHFQSNAEINHASKIRELEQKHDALKKSMTESISEEHQPNKTVVDGLKKILKRTSKSLTSHANGGNGPHTQRGYALRDRYDSAKDKLKQHSYQAWLEYCHEMDYDKGHDGLDHYA
jgi:hypothetical protein